MCDTRRNMAGFAARVGGEVLHEPDEAGVPVVAVADHADQVPGQGGVDDLAVEADGALPVGDPVGQSLQGVGCIRAEVDQPPDVLVVRGGGSAEVVQEFGELRVAAGGWCARSRCPGPRREIGVRRRWCSCSSSWESFQGNGCGSGCQAESVLMWASRAAVSASVRVTGR